MTYPKLNLAALCLACAMPLVVLADPQGPAKRPGGNDRPERPGSPGGSPGRGVDWKERGEHEFEQFRAQFLAFCEENAPNRWKELKKREGETGPGRRMTGMVMKFKVLKALENQDNDLYKIKVKQIQVEDVEYGLLLEIRDAKRAATPDPREIQKLEAKLKPVASQSVVLRLDERSQRINRLAQQLDRERKLLADDKSGQEKLVSERVNLMISEGPDFFNVKPKKGDADGPGPGIPPTTSASQSIP